MKKRAIEKLDLCVFGFKKEIIAKWYQIQSTFYFDYGSKKKEKKRKLSNGKLGPFKMAMRLVV